MIEAVHAVTAQLPVIDGTVVVLAILFGSVLITVLAGAALLGPKDAATRRLEAAGRGDAPGVLPIALRQSDDEQDQRGFARFFTPQDESERSQMRLRLLRAGYRSPSALRNYYLVRTVLGLGLPLPVILLYVFMSISVGVELRGSSFLASLPSSLWAVLLLIVIGFYGPPLWIRHRIRSRQHAIQVGFPDALDMLLVSVEAGLGLDAAVARVATEIRAAHPIIADEFAVVGLEVRAGKSRHSALRDMAERIGVDEVSSLVTVLNQSNRFGTSVADALRVYASEMRLSRMMRAEEKANKLPVKLSIAVVLCMLPAMFAVILGPIVIKVVRVLLPAVGG
jgi:tight adherence protein C